MATAADALWVDCPTCHAVSGNPCMATGSPLADGVHSGRIHSASRELA